jgi:hypothetical protein
MCVINWSSITTRAVAHDVRVHRQDEVVGLLRDVELSLPDGGDS